jgi:hypothetical protein
MTSPSVTARSAPLVTESSTTRRSTAAADPTLAGVLSNGPHHEDSTGAPILRQPPANGSTAIPTREHHRGGSPIHCAPARRRALRDRSPPSPRGASSSLHPSVNTVRPRPSGCGHCVLTPGPLRLPIGSHAPNLWFGAPRDAQVDDKRGAVTRTFHNNAGWVGHPETPIKPSPGLATPADWSWADRPGTAQ